MYSSAEESMCRLTSADKGRIDCEALLRYSEKNETGLRSLALTSEPFGLPFAPAVKDSCFKVA